MGLDMYAYKTKTPLKQPVDFTLPTDKVDLAYWRKFNNLHGWMERLYRRKGGQDESFNCAPVQLTLEDLDQLKQDAEQRVNLDPFQGFFFGGLEELSDRDVEDILKFVAEAKTAISDGYNIVYDSWW